MDVCRNVKELDSLRKGLSQAIIQVIASWHAGLVPHGGRVTLLSSSSSANCQLGIKHQNSGVIFGWSRIVWETGLWACLWGVILVNWGMKTKGGVIRPVLHKKKNASWTQHPLLSDLYYVLCYSVCTNVGAIVLLWLVGVRGQPSGGGHSHPPPAEAWSLAVLLRTLG